MPNDTLMTITKTPLRYVNFEAKRIFDIILASALVFLLLPLSLLLAGSIILDGGPVLFGQTRIGLNGHKFRCWKFRSMSVDAQARLDALLSADSEARNEWNRDHKLKNDPRITTVGRFMRKYSLDEIPQLINVLNGTMSFVGPRPIVDAEVPKYGASFDAYKRCTPGITGLWQVSGRNDVDYQTRVQMDVQYESSRSFQYDLLILVRTLRVVVNSKGAY
jgi:lipopolysaccharide/colanic/teichoic acid biosynthesis glycosyltransferase